MRIFPLFLLSLVISLISLRKKNQWKRHDENSLWYYFYGKCLTLFTTLTFVTLFYTIVSWLVDGTSDVTTLSRLETLENVLDSIKSFASYFKLPLWATVLILVGLITMDLLVSSTLLKGKVTSSFKSYQKWTKRVYSVIFLLTLFTFFGNQMGEQRAHLRVRTDKIKMGYKEIRDESEAILAAQVLQELYNKIRLALPPEIYHALDYPSERSQKLDSLRNTYEEAKQKGITDPNAEQILARYGGRSEAKDRSNDEIVNYDASGAREKGGQDTSAKIPTEDTVIPKEAKAKLSVESVEKTLANLKAQSSGRSRFVRLIKLNNVHDLLVQFPKSLTNAAKSKAFKTVVSHHPLLEPVVDLFVATFDKAVEQKIKNSLSKFADTLVEKPEVADNRAIEEAKTIVDSIDVRLPSSRLRQLNKIGSDLKDQIAQIEAVSTQVRSQIDSANTPSETTAASTVRPCTCTCLGLTKEMGIMSDASCQAACAALPPCRGD